MKKTLVIFSAFLLLFVAPAIAQERILSYHSDIEVRPDSSMAVTETIRVAAAGDQIKRGIYRDFPTTYQDKRGLRYNVGFRLISVSRDGQPDGFHTEALSNGVRIYAGRKDYFLPPGMYTYTFTYETDRQLGFFQDFDELYWNVTGNGWVFPIDHASATVVLPEGAGANVMNAEAYTGPQGAQGRDYAMDKNFLGQTTFETTRPLGSYEGLTIVVSWPKGYVTPPTPSAVALSYARDNSGLFLLLFGVLILLTYYIAVWARFGKDPARGTIIPLYHPPEGISPAGLRYIMKMGSDNKVFTAALIDMAVKGHIRIMEEKVFFSKSYAILRTGSDETVLTPEERSLSRVLFMGGDRLQLDNVNHETIGKATRLLAREMEIELERVHFLTNRHLWGWGMFISILIGCWALHLLNSDGGGEEFWALGVFFLLFPVNVLFFRLLKAPTANGRRMMDRIEGFKMFLSVTEKERLNMLNPPQITPELFEKYLPFALALDVEQKWAENFSRIVAAASQDAYRNYSPGWYHGSSWNIGNISHFTSDLGGGFSNAAAAASHPPGSSSGGGGGGSSGGGGGGGGGGGW